MTWRMMRVAMVRLYGVGFLLIGLLLVHSAYFGDRPWRFGLYLSVGVLLIAEAAGLFLFHWIARLALKLLLAGVACYFLSGIVEYGAWDALLVPLGFGGLLIAEIWFRKLDRDISAERRDGPSG